MSVSAIYFIADAYKTVINILGLDASSTNLRVEVWLALLAPVSWHQCNYVSFVSAAWWLAGNSILCFAIEKLKLWLKCMWKIIVCYTDV